MAQSNQPIYETRNNLVGSTVLNILWVPINVAGQKILLPLINNLFVDEQQVVLSDTYSTAGNTVRFKQSAILGKTDHDWVDT